ncbi:hypothetical protein SmJEL517_g05711 [Synchytrium microbalum]|uniref:Cytochrome P450 n=1 Tax=Synchytrium microbalum TaxID=1806994 RepID=A0A507BV11_9FUNG|nr:uncharacterized protein SmJEL517_g05711 [Synchytrium microbalum]TPX30809.1 hypothetical protein SmJEL517_g05711 [Synchytrium microbalum]
MSQKKHNYALPIALAAGATVVGIAGTIYYYKDHAIGTRNPKSMGLPVLKNPTPLIGNTPEMIVTNDYRTDWIAQTCKELGEAWALTLPFQNCMLTVNVQDVEFILKDPYLFEKGEKFRANAQDMLGHGIFNSDGQDWRIARKVGANIFNVKNFRDLFSNVFVEESQKLVAQIRTAASMGGIIELQDLLLRATLDSFTLIAMGRKTNAIEGNGKINADGIYTLPVEPFMQAFDGANQITSTRFSTPFWSILEYFNGDHAKMHGYLKVMNDFAKDVVDEKRAKIAAGHKGSDLLDLFMSNGNDDGTPLTDTQLRDITLNFIIAGRDTTAQTLGWTFMRLSQNPEVEKKCRAELLAVLGKDGQYTFESLKQLKYTNATFLEALRMHANVPGNQKTASADCVLPGTGTPVKKGDAIFISPYVMGYSTDIWGPDAGTFRPERWIDQDGLLIKPNQFAFPHFNAGPRICLGMNMAQQEGWSAVRFGVSSTIDSVVFMSNIIRNFSLELVREDSPEHWGVFSEDPSKRLGRSSPALTLNARCGIHFKPIPL